MSRTANQSPLSRIFRTVWEKAWWVFAIIFVGGFIFLAVTDANLLVRLFSLVFIVIGFGTLIYMERMRRQQKNSLSWRPTQGRILSSEVKKEYLRSGRGPGNSGTMGDITVYRPRVEYSYEYHGTSYQSKRIITVDINWPKKEAEAVVSRYPAEASVTVWVNPENPYQAVLERGVRNYKMKFTWAFIIGFSFLVAGATGWFVLLKVIG
jgi:hypothetical protein